MSNPLDTFLEKGAELVGGHLIARVDGVHTLLGHVNLGQLILNEAGQVWADIVGQPAPSRRKRADPAEPEAPQPEAPAEPEPTAS